jgi:UDP-N-acetyl-D-mannosaminuronate dehydrogenase
MKNICIIGLGFVGTHLLELLKSKFNVYGVDISLDRIEYLRNKNYKQIYKSLDDINEFANIVIRFKA